MHLEVSVWKFLGHFGHFLVEVTPAQMFSIEIQFGCGKVQALGQGAAEVGETQIVCDFSIHTKVGYVRFL
jgi:hypothetical protein